MRNKRLAFQQFHGKLDQILAQQVQILSILGNGIGVSVEPVLIVTQDEYDALQAARVQDVGEPVEGESVEGAAEVVETIEGATDETPAEVPSESEQAPSDPPAEVGEPEQKTEETPRPRKGK